MTLKPFIVYVTTLFVIFAITLALVLMGHKGIAGMVSIIGTIFTIIGTFFYIVFIDSKERWPELKWYDRAINVMTFKR